MNDITKLTIAIKKLLKTKEHLPESYHEGIDELIRNLANKISKI
jgi:hypothetical protein|tara:strand:+ start:255 stop:386 length:132 start_codon:yes stop_codon:yes gene_type:complete